MERWEALAVRRDGTALPLGGFLAPIATLPSIGVGTIGPGANQFL